METVGKALIVYMAEQAKDRRTFNPTYKPDHLHIAERCDAQLAAKMRALARAQQELDDYILSRSEWTRSK